MCPDCPASRPNACSGLAHWSAIALSLALAIAAGIGISPSAPASAELVLEPGAALPAAMPALEITSRGTLAFVAAHARGVHIVDISDPASPQLVATAPTEGAAYDVAVAGERLYVAAWSAGLEIFDITDPTAPVRLGAAPTRANAHAVAVLGGGSEVGGEDGRIVVTGDWSAQVFDAGDPEFGLLAFDVSDPAAPAQVGRLDTPGWAGDIVASDAQLFVADATDGLRVIDASDPTALREIGSAATEVRAYGIDVADGRAFVADNTGGLLVFDVNDPASPSRLGRLETGEAAYAVAWDASLEHVWLAQAAGGGPQDPGSVVLVDIDELGQPLEVARLATEQRAWGVAPDGKGGVWVAATGAGVLHVETGEEAPATATALMTTTPEATEPLPSPTAEAPATPAAIYLPLALRDAGPAAPPPAVTEASWPTATTTESATPVVATPTLSAPLDETAAMFDPNSVRDVRIELPPEEWELLRHEVRTMADIFGTEECLTGPSLHPFNWYTGTVTVDGLRLASVGVRKKGFLGSLVDYKPSLKIKFDEFVEGQRMFGMRRMTLNNANVDPSHIRQCLVYDLYRKAGLVAPRCNFATVRVNGQSLGLYVNLESIKKPFIARHFEDDGGNLYEGTRADFRDDWSISFERKTNKDSEDRSDIAAVVAALDAPDDQLMERLAAVVDLDTFYRFWAMEVLVGHWDSYSNNRNNYYAYHDPVSDRFTFIPWGADNTLRKQRISGGDSPASVSARAHLTRRLYLHPEGRARYVRTMRDLLEGVWDESRILAEIDRMAGVIEGDVPARERQAFRDDLVQIRSFVRGRRANVERELAQGGIEWAYPPSIAPCRRSIGTIRATFDVAYGGGSSNAVAASFTDLEGVETALDNTSVAARDEAFRTWPLYPALVINGTFSEDTEHFERGRRVLLYVFVERKRFVPGAVPLDGSRAFGWAYRQPADPKWIFPGLLWDGAITLEEASLTPGERIKGSVETDVWLWRKEPGEA